VTSRDAQPGPFAARLAGLPAEPLHDLFLALNYLCAAQLYLRDNVLLEAPLHVANLKPAPAGHWGTCPPVNWALALTAAIRLAGGPDREVEVVHGGGHAGPSALGWAYLTGLLGSAYPDLAPGRDGLRHLVARFPDAVPAGGEVTPAIPGVRYMGGELGHALAFAQGRALDRPRRVVVALLGDGECETGATAAAWTGARAIAGERHGCVLPIVLLNGMRMGGRSLLARMTADERRAYFAGLGHEAIVVRPDVRSPEGCFPLPALGRLIDRLTPVGRPGGPVLVLELGKGATGPAATYDGEVITGTARVHKRPLDHPGDSAPALAHLERWLRSYSPWRLLPGGRPAAATADLLAIAPGRPSVPVRAAAPAAEHEQADLATALAALRGQVELRVFSPDELWSNGVGLVDERGDGPPWLAEVLNEHLCDGWARGFCCDGDRAAVVISYEAFAALFAGQIAQALKAARACVAGEPRLRAPVHVFTSLGWRNTYSHRDTTLTDWLVGEALEGTRLHFPLLGPAAAIAHGCASAGHHFVWYCKHTRIAAADWPRLTPAEPGAWVRRAAAGQPALLLTAIGDRAADIALVAQDRLQERGVDAAFVALTELHAARDRWLEVVAAAGADPDHQPPVLLLGTPGRGALGRYAAGLDGLRSLTVRGFDPGAGPLGVAELAHHCRMDADTVVRDAIGLAAPREAHARA
jgi:xylulose-5-phosphate/fructose-6-phosphate phosphoketolase